jgi:hypothetical protein
MVLRSSILGHLLQAGYMNERMTFANVILVAYRWVKSIGSWMIFSTDTCMFSIQKQGLPTLSLVEASQRYTHRTELERSCRNID